MNLLDPFKERRRSQRVSRTLQFNLVGYDNGLMQAETVDIGLHGALCRVDRDVPMMTQLKVELSIGHQAVIRAKGVIVRKTKDLSGDQYLIAIFFSEISQKDQEHLARFVNDKSKPQ